MILLLENEHLDIGTHDEDDDDEEDKKLGENIQPRPNPGQCEE